MVITDAAGGILYANPAMERITGHGRSEALGRQPDMFAGATLDRAVYAETWAAVRAGRTWKGCYTGTGKDGRRHAAELTVAPVRDGAGEAISYVGVVRDVTGEAAMQAQLLQTQKLEALGRLAGGIAHDFNNILTVILGNAELLKAARPADAEVAQATEAILGIGRQAAERVSQLLVFAREGRTMSQPVDVHAAVRDVTDVLSRTVDPRIAIDRQFHSRDGMAMGDAAQLHNALLNLGLNARDAMPDGGRLSFVTEDIDADAEHPAALGADLPPGGYLQVTVRDTGIGMDAETKARIFDPFFTTKAPGEGTGLGLASVYACARNHGGAVAVDSKPGEGTTFRLLLPPVPRVAAEAPPEQPAPPPAGAGHVLLVEDEQAVREVMARALRQAGYEVTECTNGQQALRLFRARRGTFDLVVLDLIMPRMDGLRTFGAMKRLKPDVRAIVTSGLGGDPRLSEAMEAGAMDFLNKPIQPEQLVRMVQRHARRRRFHRRRKR